MTEEATLFGEGEPTGSPVEPAWQGIAEWQIKQLRQAFDSAGVTVLSERQAFVEKVTGTQVASLAALTPAQGRLVLERLSELRRGDVTPTGSSWDQRDEATWIDRL